VRFSARLQAAVLAAITVLGAATMGVAASARADEVATVHSADLSAVVFADAGALSDAVPTGIAPVDAQKALVLLAAAERAAREAVREARIAREKRIMKTRAEIIRVARKQLGKAYVAGHSGPHAFDCSGFTRFVYKTVTGKELPHYSRDQYRVAKRIPLKQAKPGDLVFFFRNGAEHVGIYLGKGRMIDAANPRDDVSINPVFTEWWGKSFTAIGRVLPAT
jgi:cell wall-associated NlpC family hydrolase